MKTILCGFRAYILLQEYKICLSCAECCGKVYLLEVCVRQSDSTEKTAGPVASQRQPASSSLSTVIEEGKGTVKLTKTHLMFVDVLNIVSCFAVIILHVSLNVFSPQPVLSWVRAVCMQASAIFAVPIFFMISGMNLINYRGSYSTYVFFRKRFTKIGKALIGGSVVCYLVFCAFPDSFYGADSFKNAFGLTDFIRKFLTNSINDTYWFLYGIMYLYILAPILSLVCHNKRVMQYVFGLSLFISVGIPLAERLGVKPQYFNSLFNWQLFASVSVLYFVAGYLLRDSKTSFLRMVLYGIGFTLSTVAMIFLGLWSNGYHKSEGLTSHYDNYFIGITSIFCVIQVISLFLFFKGLENRFQRLSIRLKKFISQLSGATLGIYLFHILLINWMAINLNNTSLSWTLQLPVLQAILVYIVTAFFVLTGKLVIAQVRKTFRRKNQAQNY